MLRTRGKGIFLFHYPLPEQRPAIGAEATVILRNFGVVLFSVISLVNVFTEIKKDT